MYGVQKASLFISVPANIHATVQCDTSYMLHITHLSLHLESNISHSFGLGVIRTFSRTFSVPSHHTNAEKLFYIWSIPSMISTHDYVPS